MSDKLIPITVPLDVCTDGVEIELGVDMAITPISGEKYEGAYIVTPTNHAQVLPMAGLNMEEDVVVEAIPSNYGLITWNGTTLTVS